MQITSELASRKTEFLANFNVIPKTCRPVLMRREASMTNSLSNNNQDNHRFKLKKRKRFKIYRNCPTIHTSSSNSQICEDTYFLFIIKKSIFSLQILLTAEEITAAEVDFLLRFPIKPHVTSPVDFLSNTAWGGICSLASKDDFRNLDRDIETQAKRWKKLVESECPEKEKFPQEWKNKTALQRLCMMRALRPDRMTYAMA